MSKIPEAMRALEAAVRDSGLTASVEFERQDSMMRSPVTIRVGPWSGHGKTVDEALQQIATEAEGTRSNGAKVIAAVTAVRS